MKREGRAVRVAPVLVRAVQQVAAEEQDAAGGHLDRDGSGLVEAARDLVAVDVRQVVGVALVDDPGLVAVRQDPQASVRQRRVGQRDPHAGQGAVARRDGVLVLVPRAAVAAGRLHDEHALQALVGAIPEWHVGADDVVQDAADAGMGHGVADDRAVDVRLPQVHVAADEPFIILGPVDRLDLVAPPHPFDGRARVVAPVDPPQLPPDPGALGLVHQAGDQHVPALDVGSPQFVARGLRRIEPRDRHRPAASRNHTAMLPAPRCPQAK